MGIFDKLAFWKKDEPDFDRFAEKETQGMPLQDNLGLTEKSPFADLPTEPAAPAPTGMTVAQPSLGKERDFELISSKLDTIKALLTSLDHRVANLEKVAGIGEPKQKLW